jgi:hypothetical protein
MNRRNLLLLPLLGAALAWSCSKNSGTGGGTPPQDAGEDVADDVAADVPPPPPRDSSMGACTFNGTDPIAFCLQKTVLQSELTDAYAKGRGVPPSWDAMGHPGSGHSWRDDVGFAASIGAYHCSSSVYGDNQLTPMLDAIMPDLGATIVQELKLTGAPTGYDGEDYFRLRAAATGLQYANDTMDSATVAQLAEAFGRNLQTTYAQTVALPEGGTVTVLGTPDGMGNVAYVPAQVIMAAAALVDLANVHASDPDAGADVSTWVATALAAVDYVWARGRDTSTGLFFQQLVTSEDPGHDALGQGMPTPDALLTDVQAEAVLGLARMQDGVNALMATDAGFGDASILPSMYWNEANTIAQSLVTAGLFDGSIPVAEAGIPNPVPAGAFMEALVPSTGAIDTNKTTIGNAWLLGGVHRVGVGVLGPLTEVLTPQLAVAVAQQTPANSSLFTVVVDTQTGNPVQTDYLRASSKNFHYATVFSPDGGTGGQEPGATSYRADAVAAVIEGLTQLWRGTPSAPTCAP